MTSRVLAVSLTVLAAIGNPALPAPAQVGGRIDVVGVKKVRGMPLYTFRLSNTPNTPALYTGYEQGAPMYQIQVKQGPAWKIHALGWCGTGMGTREFTRTRSTVTFSAFAPQGKKTWRLGVPLSQTRDGVSRPSPVVWSQPIRTGAK